MAYELLSTAAAFPLYRGMTHDNPDLIFHDDFVDGITAWTGATRVADSPSGGYSIKNTSAGSTAFYRTMGDNSILELHQPYHVTFWKKGYGEQSFGIARSSNASWTLRNVVIRLPLTLAIAKSWFQHAFSAFAGQGDLQIADLHMEKITSGEFAAYATTIMSQLGAHCRPFTDPDRLALLPITVDKLVNGGELTVLSLGDSWQGTHAYSAYDALLMRSFPQCHVAPYLLNAGGAGMDTWDDHLEEIAARVQDLAPDLVYLGGISDLANLSAWTAVVECIRGAKADVEIVAGSTSNGLGAERDAAIESIAEDLELAFFPAGEAMNGFLADSGLSLNSILCDGVHLNERGQQVLAEGFAWFLGASAQ